MWNTVKELKDLIYRHNINEEYHVQNRTLNSILAKHLTCSDSNALFKMYLDAQALKYHYQRKHPHNVPDKKSQKKKQKLQ